MIALGLNHIGHAASAVSTVLHLPERGRTVAPALLTLAGFTPVQVELLIGGFLLTVQGIYVALRRYKSHLPNHIASRQSPSHGFLSRH
jgi:hypothetical protein